MKNLYGTLNRNSTYFFLYALLLILSTLFCVLVSKPDGFLEINHLHTPFFDNFFILFTQLGNGLFVVGLMVFLLIRKKFGWSFQIGISFLVSGLLVQVLKQFFHSPRPKIYFGSGAIHDIHGITCTGLSSFPSGHTATIFALTTLLSLYFTGRKAGLFFFWIAALTGFSRIYLSQHFPIDILCGSLTGVLTSLIVYLFIPLKIFERRFSKAEFEKQSIKLQ